MDAEFALEGKIEELFCSALAEEVTFITEEKKLTDKKVDLLRILKGIFIEVRTFRDKYAWGIVLRVWKDKAMEKTKLYLLSQDGSGKKVVLDVAVYDIQDIVCVI